MVEIVTLDIIKRFKDDVIKLPEGSVVTADAASWAKSHHKALYIGSERMNSQSIKNNVDEVVISVVGRDKVGIIAAISNMLADKDVNILDINQTLIHGLFTMIMVVDIKNCKDEFGTLKESLDKLGGQIGVKIDAQKEAIFDFMQRL